MAKFHINGNGEAGKCSAVNAKCPFGGAEDHFTSVEAAREQAEAILEAQNGWGSAKRQEDPYKLTPQAVDLINEIAALESNPARRHYGFPEDEMTRSNIEGAIVQKKAELEKLMPHAGFAKLRYSVDDEDRRHAIDVMAVQLGNQPENSWDKVMGPNVRRTKNSIEKYQNYMRNKVRLDPQHKAKVDNLTKMHRDREIFGRAYRQKIELPKQYEDAFEKAWADPKTGEKKLRQDAHDLKVLRHNFESGFTNASRIVGTGLRNPKKEAAEYLDRRDKEVWGAITTRGRSHFPTVERVQAQAKKEGWPLAE